MIYRLAEEVEPVLSITWDDGTEQSLLPLELPADESSELFKRSGRIRQLTLVLSEEQLFHE